MHPFVAIFTSFARNILNANILLRICHRVNGAPDLRPCQAAWCRSTKEAHGYFNREQGQYNMMSLEFSLVKKKRSSHPTTPTQDILVRAMHGSIRIHPCPSDLLRMSSICGARSIRIGRSDLLSQRSDFFFDKCCFRVWFYWAICAWPLFKLD